MIEKYHLKYFHRAFFNILTIDIFSLISIKKILNIISECEQKYNNSFNPILLTEYLLLMIFNETRVNETRVNETRINKLNDI